MKGCDDVKKYIRIDEKNSILEGWSEGLNPGRDTTDSVEVADNDSFQFYLPGFEDLGMNPQLYDEEFRPKYRWDPVAEKAVLRSEEELAQDLDPDIHPELREQDIPDEMEQLKANVDFLMAMVGMNPEGGSNLAVN